MNLNYLIFIIISILYGGCLHKPDTDNNFIPVKNKKNITECQYQYVYDSIISLDDDELLRIQLQKDCNSNILIELFGKNDFLWDASGIGMSDIVTGENPIKTVNLDNDKQPEYIIDTYVYGSTYGAGTLFIVWLTGREAHISHLYFDRAFIEDVDKNGIYEIVDYSEGIKNIYSFYKGELILFKR